MNIKDRAFSINRLFLLVFLSSICFGSGAVLKTIYMEEMCYATSSATLNLRFHKSVILASFPTGPLDCIMHLKPELDNSVVIAFYRYSIKEGDSLQFRDKHNFQLSLTGDGVYTDESKALLFDGPLSIHYATNNSYIWNGIKFQMVITQVHDAPCNRDEFKCRNNKCIPIDLACDKHNHCGDMSDEEHCSPKDKAPEDRVVITEYRNPWIISIIVCSAILAIMVITFSALLIRRWVVEKKKDKQPELPTVAAVTDNQHPASPTVFGHIRQSLRSKSKSQASSEQASSSRQSPETYDVPSMYPQLPSAPVYHGVDNPEFKADE